MTNNGINANLAKLLIKNYGDNHLATINSTPALTQLRQPGSTSDSRAAWFSFEDLRRFMAQIESNTFVTCNNVSGPLGIRFYYGEYPDCNSPLWGTPVLPIGAPLFLERYAGMHTLLLVPTYNDGTNNVDFEPNFANAGGTPMPITQVFQTVAPTPGTATNVLMMNHGQLAPPPYPTIGNFGPTTGAYMVDIANS